MEVNQCVHSYDVNARKIFTEITSRLATINNAMATIFFNDLTTKLSADASSRIIGKCEVIISDYDAIITKCEVIMSDYSTYYDRAKQIRETTTIKYSKFKRIL